MIDIEGLGDTPDGVVLAVGAVKFDFADAHASVYVMPADHNPRDDVRPDPESTVFLRSDQPSFHANINIASSMRAGLRVDGGTIAWWLGGADSSPDDAARRGLFTPTPLPLSDALALLRDFCRDNEGVWANPVSYDLVTLAQSYRAVRQQLAWRWKRTYDVRSYLKGIPRPAVPRYGVRHHPTWDACNQATWVLRGYAWKQEHMKGQGP